MRTRGWVLAAVLGLAVVGPAGAGDGPAPEPPKSEARAFPYEDGVVDLLVIGPAAKTLFDRLPGKAQASACGGEGLNSQTKCNTLRCRRCWG